MVKKPKVLLAEFHVDDVEHIARTLGVEPETVKETVCFSMGIHEEIRRQELSLKQCLGGLMSVVADLLRHNVPPVDRAEVCTSIFHNLWGASGLPTDTNAKVLQYKFSKEKIN